MFKKALIASAMLVAAVGAQAQSAGLSLTGTITPASCTLILGSGGVADYGTSTAVTVRALATVAGTNVHYNMGTKTFTWTVACTAATPLQLAFTDNKAGKVLAMDSADSIRYGLVDGASGTTSIGSYTVDFTSAAATTVDGVAALGFLNAPTGTTAWASPYNSTVGTAQPGRAVGFKGFSTTQTSPSQMTNASGTMTVSTSLGKAYADAAFTAITLNGSGTITLQYL